MSVYKDKWNGYKNSWRVEIHYKDWQGKKRRHEKRGFDTKKEAQEYEREFLAKIARDINMRFGSFIDTYYDDVRPQLKKSTMASKEQIVEKHIRPYFEDRALSSINATDILQWQNELLMKRDENGRAYSQTYLRTMQNQLHAIFNHAVKYYDLPKNPCITIKKMGKSKPQEMLFWTKEEYLKFSEQMKSKPLSYYAFQILYWTGIRSGELLALTKEDFDLDKQTLRINKTYQIVKGKAMVTSPKTEKSIRTIDLPKFLCDEMQDYFDSLYRFNKKSRLFPVTKKYLHHEMDRGSKAAGVKRIRIHDLRHSSCALLIDMGYSPIQIAERLGHESTSVTEQYAHLYPSVQKDMAKRLDDIFNGEEEKDG